MLLSGQPLRGVVRELLLRGNDPLAPPHPDAQFRSGGNRVLDRAEAALPAATTVRVVVVALVRRAPCRRVAVDALLALDLHSTRARRVVTFSLHRSPPVSGATPRGAPTPPGPSGCR